MRILLVALLAGLAYPLTLAPYHLGWLMPVLLAVPVRLSIGASPRRAFATGYVWALTGFAASFYWTYLSLHDIAGLPALLAAPLTLLLPAWLALFPALALALAARWARRSGRPTGTWLLAFPLLMTLADWLRGWVITGFPWGALGYTQVPDGPLAGYLPVTGIFGLSWMVALTAAVLAWLLWLRQTGNTRPQRRPIALTVLLVAALWSGGVALKQREWTHPVGKPLTVSLAQGAIPQSLKWDPDAFGLTLRVYAEQVAAARGRLIILPETAFPLMYDEMPAQYVNALRDMAAAKGAELVTGAPTRLADGRYFNSVVSVTGREQRYSKDHLVPFGEFIPLPWLTGWLYRFMDIPLSGFTPGGTQQAPLTLAGERVAFNVCYEDSFGEELIGPAREATLLANVSNMAWFGNSNAAWQHLQLAQTRALETGRPMVRATNTGLTAAIDHRGQVLAEIPQFTRGVLEVTVQPRSGLTPYMRWGNLPVVLAALAGLALWWGWTRRQGRKNR